MKPSFNPTELGMTFLDMDKYQINADERLEDEIVIWGHLPFKLVGDKYVNEIGVKVYIKQVMEVFVLLKGYDYEGFGSDVEVFSTREAAEARKQAYSDGEVKLKGQDDILFDYDYDLLKVVKRKIG